MRLGEPPIDDGWDDAAPEQSPSATTGQSFERGDQVELAERLAGELQAESPTVYADGRFYHYRAAHGIFEILPPAELSVRVQAYSGSRVAIDTKPLRLKNSDVNGALTLMGARLHAEGFFDDAPAGLAFANGFLLADMIGTSFRPHSAEHRARYAYPFPYGWISATPSRFLDFLSQVFRDDEDAQDKAELIREFLGVSLLGKATKFQQALVFVGGGSNGKGVLSQLMEASAPPGSVCAIAPQNIGHEYRRAALAGKLLNIVGELPEADIADSAAWKDTIAGDTLEGRATYKDCFYFKPRAGHVYSANNLPGSADHSHGFWRRLLVIKFNRVFTERDKNPNLLEELLLERPQIVSWALRGAENALKRGRYTLPPSVAEAVEAWRRNADQVSLFAEECLTHLDPKEPLSLGTKGSAIYDAFKSWAINNGHRPLASNKLPERLKNLGIVGKKSGTMIYPVRLKW